jgi:tetratricopeptide (TPR) repeat protein
MFLLNAQAAEALGDAAYGRQSRDRAEYNETRLPSDPVTAIIHPVSVKYGAARLLAEGKAMIDAERWDDAARILSPVVAESDDDDAVLLLAGAELKRGRPEQAIRLLSGQIRRRGAMPVSLLLMGDAFDAADKPDQALTTWELTARFQSSPDVHERLAKHSERAGRDEDARRQRALVQQASGITQLRHAKPAAAKAAFEAAVALDPSPAMSWFYLGECRRLLGDIAAARDAYQKALGRAPNHGRARAALALMEQ